MKFARCAKLIHECFELNDNKKWGLYNRQELYNTKIKNFLSLLIEGIDVEKDLIDLKKEFKK
jgi:hypothetical protein